MEINLGIDKEARGKVTQMLLALQADEYVLYTKTRNFHWNAKGPHFMTYHKFFEEQYNEIDETIDEVAERALTLGAPALGSLKEILEYTRISESPTRLKINEMIQTLVQDHELIVRQLRKDSNQAGELGDEGTADFMIALMEKHEKMAWLLRAYLE